MLYKIPSSMKSQTPLWPAGVGTINGRLEDGTIIGIPALKNTNYLVIGTTGFGKTVFTKAVVHKLLDSSPETLGVFFQIKPDDFTSEFMQDGDKVITYSSQEIAPEFIFQWNMIKEIRLSSDHEAELKRLGNSFFSHLLEDSKNRLWAGAARDTFIAFLRVIVESYNDCPSNGAVIDALRNLDIVSLLSYLSKHPRNHSLVRKSFDFDPAHPDAPYKPPRKAEDLMFFLNDVLEVFNGNFASSTGADTISEFLQGCSGRNLFIQHNLSQEEAGRPFELYFLRKIIEDKMSPSTHIKSPVLMILDEADKIGGDFGVTKAVTLGRGYGLQVILSTQSLENLFALSPEKNREHTTNASMSGFPVIVAFHCGDANTLSNLQTLFGSQRKEITTLGISRYVSPVTKSELEPIVTNLEFASLDVGQAYLKIMSHLPQKVTIICDK